VLLTKVKVFRSFEHFSGSTNSCIYTDTLKNGVNANYHKKKIPVSDRTKSVFIKAIDSLRCLRTPSLFAVEKYAALVQNLLMLRTVVYMGLGGVVVKALRY
jgi:hypothetical protein